MVLGAGSSMLGQVRRVRMASSVRMVGIQSRTPDCRRLWSALNRFSEGQVCRAGCCWEPRSEYSICIAEGDKSGEDVIVEENS